MSKYTYVIEHIDGDDNVFADILTRWTKGYRNDGYKLKTICSLLVQSAEQMVPSAEKIEWPNMENFRGSQAQNDGDQKIGLKFDAVDRLWKMNDHVWIPSADKDLQLKLMVVSHCGIMGHRGADATRSVLRETFLWNELDKDVEVFVGQCFHCILTRSGELIPRPLATALHGERPNEVLRMEFLYMGPGIDGKKYL